MESGVYFGVEYGVTFGVIFGVNFGVGFFSILLKYTFCFIYKNSDYNLWLLKVLFDGLTTLKSMAEVNKQKLWRDK